MGGALILAAITLSTLCWADLGNRFIWVVLFVTLGYGAIGWIDDYRKIVHHDPHGMSAREKFSWQSVIGLAAAFYLALALAVEPGGTFAEAIGAWYDARFPLDVTANIHPTCRFGLTGLPAGADRLHCLRLHRDRRIEQCGEPHRWADGSGHSAHGAGRLCALGLYAYAAGNPDFAGAAYAAAAPHVPGAKSLQFSRRLWLASGLAFCGSTLIRHKFLWATWELLRLAAVWARWRLSRGWSLSSPLWAVFSWWRRFPS